MDELKAQQLHLAVRLVVRERLKGEEETDGISTDRTAYCMAAAAAVACLLAS